MNNPTTWRQMFVDRYLRDRFLLKEKNNKKYFLIRKSSKKNFKLTQLAASLKTNDELEQIRILTELFPILKGEKGLRSAFIFAFLQTFILESRNKFVSIGGFEQVSQLLIETNNQIIIETCLLVLVMLIAEGKKFLRLLKMHFLKELFFRIKKRF